VHREEAIDGLQLYDDASLDQDVDTVAAVDVLALVRDADGPLPLEDEAEKLQLPTQASLVGRFEKSGPERAMHFDARADDLVGPILVPSDLLILLFHHPPIRRPLCPVARPTAPNRRPRSSPGERTNLPP